MYLRALDFLGCPKCRCALKLTQRLPAAGDVIEQGELSCPQCQQVYPVVRGIPRFVPADNYAESFGQQWNRYRTEQIDMLNGVSLTETRFITETGKTDLKGQRVMEAGCGAGRFLEVASRLGADVVGVDLSNAVDAAAQTLADRPNVHLVQASIFELPFQRGVFDGVYSIGVLQHTPDPLGAIGPIFDVLKKHGWCTATVYERRRFTMLYSKYLARRLTTRLPSKVVTAFVEKTMPLAFPVTDVLFRLPKVGKLFRFAIPVANYVDEKALSREQRYQWAVLDTVDMLTPRYDNPQTEADLRHAFVQAGFTDVTRPSVIGLCLRATRPS